MNSNTTRNRIKEHVKIRAGELLGHELNPRTHNDVQRAALRALYAEVGFSRSLLAYEVDTPEGKRLKLIDGHLRQSINPDLVVDVEVLDVDEDEARKLLLSMDPLAALAGFDEAALAELRNVVSTQDETLAELWAKVGEAGARADAELKEATKKFERRTEGESLQETYAVLINCEDEQQQVTLLRRFKSEGLKVKALIT